jgi:hypothetical protein
LVKVFDNQNSRSFTLQCDINKRQSTPTRIKKKLRKKNKTTIDSFANSNQFLSEVSTPLTIGMKTLYRAATITLIDRSTTKKIARFSFPVTTMPHKQLVGGGGAITSKKKQFTKQFLAVASQKVANCCKVDPFKYRL